MLSKSSFYGATWQRRKGCCWLFPLEVSSIKKKKKTFISEFFKNSKQILGISLWNCFLMSPLHSDSEHKIPFLANIPACGPIQLLSWTLLSLVEILLRGLIKIQILIPSQIFSYRNFGLWTSREWNVWIFIKIQFKGGKLLLYYSFS